MKKRKKLIQWLFEKSESIYTRYFKKNTPWSLTKSDLLTYEKHTFGFHLGQFLEDNGFDLIPKVERHDAYHVLTCYSTTVEDEIAQQYLCLGNGKRSSYLFGVVILGTFLLPDYLGHYLRSYQIGKKANTFHNLDFRQLLNTSYFDVRSCIFSTSQINTLKTYHHA